MTVGQSQSVWEPVAAAVLDTYCQPLLAHYLAYANNAQPLLYFASQPTVYVLSASGGSGASSSSQSTTPTASSGKSGGSSGGGGGATASVDNPTALLLSMLSKQLKNLSGKCDPNQLDSQGRLPRQHRIESALTFSSGGTTVPCESQSNVAIVPETQWTIEDFRNQCAGDPLHDGKGTLAGVVLNGAIITYDTSFRILTTGGGSEADFGAQLIGCSADTGVPRNQALFTQLISSGWTTARPSLFVPALVGTLIAANLSAKAGYLVPLTANQSSAQALASANASTQRQNTSLAVGTALGAFAANISQLTVGDPSSALTLRRTFENWSGEFDLQLQQYCSLNSASSFCTSFFPNGIPKAP